MVQLHTTIFKMENLKNYPPSCEEPFKHTNGSLTVVVLYRSTDLTEEPMRNHLSQEFRCCLFILGLRMQKQTTRFGLFLPVIFAERLIILKNEQEQIT